MEIGALGVYVGLFLGLYLQIFLLISFFEKRPERKSSYRPARYPTVAVLIPCWNKARSLSGTVESLLELDYPKEKLSIIMVDDGSTDNTWEVAQRFANNPQIKLFRKENEGSKYAALNFGLARSDSELVGCLDADSFVERDALLEIVKKFETDKEVMAAAPIMRVNRPRNVLELMQAADYTFGIFWKKMFDNIGAISVLPGPFSFYRRELFDKIGPFRKAHHTEDMEMAFRMHANGLKITNVHTAVVYTNVPSTLGSLIRQRTRWSRGFLENSRDYAYMYFNRRFGNFGLLVLPFGLAGVVTGLYAAAYTLYNTASWATTRVLDMTSTGIPVHLPTLGQVEWLYAVDTGGLLPLILLALCFSIMAILLGSHIGRVRLPLSSFVSFFLLFGMLAPVWLARAAWDTLLRRERGWLT